MPDSPMPIPEIEALKELAPTWHVPQSGGCKQDGRNQCAEELLSLIPAIEKAFERETYAVSVLAESTKGLLARAERAEKSLRLALDAYVQEKVVPQWKDAKVDPPPKSLDYVLARVDIDKAHEWGLQSEDNREFYKHNLVREVDVFNTIFVRHWAVETDWLTHWMPMPEFAANRANAGEGKS